ncbi:MAG: TetR/AcrR family transcriptional regulator [Actinomycetota bacterium]|nr:TetR/AcrR family transcriptional regulator [Actinomycetota bacterium]
MPPQATTAGDAERPLRADAERNRLRILEAAAEVFAERGLGVTLDDIARHAGVGVGTVYRRFPDKEHLIDALFEARIEEMVAIADAGLAHPDPFAGLVHFLEHGLELQATDRGLKELMHNSGLGAKRVAHARAQMAPRVLELVSRAHASGQLRADVAGPDMPLITLMLGTVIDITHDIRPDVWRRLLAIVIDGLRANPGAATPLPVPPLELDEVQRAMGAPRTRRGA